MKIHLMVAIALTITLSGCLHKKYCSRLIQISLDMKKNEVIEKLGEPDVVRGAMINKFEQKIELWEYRLVRAMSGGQIGAGIILTVISCGLLAPIFLDGGIHETYWLYFYDNRLVRWSKAGDWEKEADTIHEIRFR